MLAKKGTVMLFQEDNLYGVFDFDNQQEICKRSKYIQFVKEHFEHYWRRKYAPQRDDHPEMFQDDAHKVI